MSKYLCRKCYRAFIHNSACPRCGSKDTTIKPKTDIYDVLEGHTNHELDETLSFKAFRHKDGWFVNVETWVDGKTQHGITSVPLEVMKSLIKKAEEFDIANPPDK